MTRIFIRQVDKHFMSGVAVIFLEQQSGHSMKCSTTAFRVWPCLSSQAAGRSHAALVPQASQLLQIIPLEAACNKDSQEETRIQIGPNRSLL